MKERDHDQRSIGDFYPQTSLEVDPLAGALKYKSLLDGLGVGLWGFDPGGRITYVNPFLLSLLNYRLEKIIGKKMSGFITGDNRAEFEELLLKVRHGRSSNGILHLIKENGETVPMRLGMDPLMDRANNIGGGICRMELVDDVRSRDYKDEIDKLARFPRENPNPVLRVGKDGMIMYGNMACAPLFKHWKIKEGQFLPDEWCKIVFCSYTSGKVKMEEMECDDQVYSMTFAPQRDSRYVNVYGMNITHRKKAELSLALERGQLLSIFDSIDHMVYVTDPVTNRVLYANKYLTKLLGSDPLGGLCYQEFQGLDAPCDFCSNGIIMGMKGDTYRWEHHNSLLDMDLIVFDRIITWPDGKDVRFEFAVDNTREKKMREALEERTSRLQNRMKELNCLYQMTKLLEEPDSSVQNVFEKAAYIIPGGFHYPEITCVNINFEGVKFKTGNFKRSNWRLASDIISRNELVGYIEVFYLEEMPCLDEGPFSLEERKLLNAIGDLLGNFIERKRAHEEIRVLNEDLEGRVRSRTSELKTINQELEAFAYSVSHDLRAPLRRIDGFAQALYEDHFDKLDESGRNYFLRIKKNAREMGYLIDAMLKLSRIAQHPLDMERVNLSDMVLKMSEQIRESDPHRKFSFKVQKDVFSICDRQLMKIALENLMGNAEKFTSQREESYIEFGKDNIDGNSVFFIKDNGTGFDIKFKEKIFAPFQRLHNEGEFPGMGIGLSIVSRIIAKHGGDIWADSAIDSGSVFYFNLE